MGVMGGHNGGGVGVEGLGRTHNDRPGIQYGGAAGGVIMGH